MCKLFFYVIVFQELSEHYETKVKELITEIRTLENEIGHLSTSVLAKEKETMRKDLEKAKAKLKESKLRNTIQEKTKLEVITYFFIFNQLIRRSTKYICLIYHFTLCIFRAKKHLQREIKRLHSQKTILERDGRRRDSILERNSNVFYPKKGKGFGVNIDQVIIKNSIKINTN